MLRDARPDAVVTFEGDHEAETLHLAAVEDGGPPVAIATFLHRPTALRLQARRPVQLRGMAVHPERQATGVGRALLETAIERLRDDDIDVLWANARDEALGFYQRLGMEVVGAGFLTETGRPHHAVVLDVCARTGHKLSPGDNL